MSQLKPLKSLQEGVICCFRKISPVTGSEGWRDLVQRDLWEVVRVHQRHNGGQVRWQWGWKETDG